MKFIFSFLFMLLTILCLAQPDTDIYVLDIKLSQTNLSLENLKNISENSGYDNQPSFSSTGHLMYASTRDGQTDIISVDLKTNTKTWLTATDGSEYSPTQMPNNIEVSSILLEKDGRQLLWIYPIAGGEGSVLIPYLKIGYHAWYDQMSLYAFVLGPVSTFQVINLENQTAKILEQNIGRSLHKVPNKKAISFVDKSSETWIIKLYYPETGEFQEFGPTLEGSEDMVWMENGAILMANGSEIFIKESKGADWKIIRDLAESGITAISRIAIHPNQKTIAIAALK